MENTNIPNEDEILAYAHAAGLRNVSIKLNACGPVSGYTLHGTGRDISGWPLVWRICYDTKIAIGCGSTEWHQIDPKVFTLPLETEDTGDEE